MSFEIILAKREYLEDLTKIYNQAILKGGCTCDTETFTTAQRESWFNSHQNEKYPLYACLFNDQVVGYGYLTPYRAGRKALDHVAEISYYLDEKVTGKGFGSQLLEFLIGQCPKRDITILVAILLGINVKSVSMLKKHGFELWGSMPQIAKFDFGVSDHVYYGRQV